MLISEKDAKRISTAIAAAERGTSGEIFCVIARQSGDYRLVPVVWAAALALLLPLPLILLTPMAARWIYLAQLVAFIASALVLSLPFLRDRVVPRRLMHHRAHAEAVRQFCAHGLHKTERRTGVLIFASEVEHYAEVIADTGIHAKVKPEVWDDAVAVLIDALGKGRAADGFVAAIERCGAVLAKHFPPGALDRNELPDKLVVI